MKYYLLTSNLDWADEHNVPALNVKTETELKEWEESLIGAPNENYEEELKAWNFQAALNTEMENKAKEVLGETFPNIPYKKWPYELRQEYLGKHKHQNHRDKPKKILYVDIYAALGNSGDGYEEQFKDSVYFKDLVEKGQVSVNEVSKEFFDTFNDYNLSYLSLSNIVE